MTTTKKITKAQALAALKRVVERHGKDTLYKERAESLGMVPVVSYNGPACQYVSTAGPRRKAACLIGVLLHDEYGLSLEKLERMDRGLYGDASALVSVWEDDKGRKLLPPFTRDAVLALNKAQNVQDCGDSWGDALDAARNFKAER